MGWKLVKEIRSVFFLECYLFFIFRNLFLSFWKVLMLGSIFLFFLFENWRLENEDLLYFWVGISFVSLILWMYFIKCVELLLVNLVMLLDFCSVRGKLVLLYFIIV